MAERYVAKKFENGKYGFVDENGKVVIEPKFDEAYDFKGGFAIIKNGEVYIVGMHISPYEQGNIFNKDPLRDRKLLLNRREINKLIGLTKQKGYSLVPLNMYFKGNIIKIELGIGKGKKLYDKREDIAKKDAERRIRQQKMSH